jgi:GH24 family phage-related lysozyme (muramidase)
VQALSLTAGLVPLGASAAAAAEDPVPRAAAKSAVVLQVPFPCGQTWHGNSDRSSAHEGQEIDFNRGKSPDADKGAPVLAAAPGRVVLAQFVKAPDGLGNVVKIRHADGSHTLYAHLDKIDPDMDVRAHVDQGQRIGTLGNTSDVSHGITPHLHFEHRARSSQSTLKKVMFDGKPFGYPDEEVTSRNTCDDDHPAAKPAVHTAADDLDGRVKPRLNPRDVRNAYERGDRVNVVCRTTGETAYGLKTWALTGRHLYVPAAILRHDDGKRGLAPSVPVCELPRKVSAETDLNGRHSKDKQEEGQRDRYRKGADVRVECSAYGGETYHGQHTWARTADGLWVVREYLDTPGRGLIAGLPRCDMDKPEETGGGVDPGPRTPVARLTASAKTVPFIADEEGFKATPYNDARRGGNCTVGYGEKLHDGSCTSEDLRRPPIKEAEAMAELTDRVRTDFVPKTRRLLKGVEMHQHEFDAMVSMAYNLGVEELSGTNLHDALRDSPSSWHRVPRLMEAFVKDDGKYVCGLHLRRMEEGQVFRDAEYKTDIPERMCLDR